MKTKLLSLILALALLAGCTSAPTPAITITNTATLPPTATATAEPSPTPTATPVPLPMEIPPADAVYPSSIEDRVITPEQIQVMKDAFLKMADDPAIQPKVDLIQKNLLAIAEKDGIESPTVTGYADGGRWGMVVSDAKGTTYRLQSTPPPVWTTLAGKDAYEKLNNCDLDTTPYRFNPLETPIEIPEDNLVVNKQYGKYYIRSIFDPISQEELIMEDTGFIYDRKNDKLCQPWFIYNLRDITFNYRASPQGYIIQDGQWIIIFIGVKPNGSNDQQYVLQMRNEPEWSNVKDAGAYSELTSGSFDPVNFRLVPMIYPGIPEEAEFALVNQEGWLVSVFIEPSGEVAAWYDTNDGQYRTADGNKLEIVYTPFEPGTTTWEDCQKNIIPWDYDQDILEKIHTFDQEYEWKKDLTGYYGRSSNQMSLYEGWANIQLSYKILNADRTITFCGILDNPYGDTLSVYSIPISIPTQPGRIDMDSSYWTTTILVALSDKQVRYFFNTYYGEGSEPAQKGITQRNPADIIQKFTDTTGTVWNSFGLSFVTSENPLHSNIPEIQGLQDLFNANFSSGTQQLLKKALMGEATEEEMLQLKNAIFPVWVIIPDLL